jgi:hypothetical protein
MSETASFIFGSWWVKLRHSYLDPDEWNYVIYIWILMSETTSFIFWSWWVKVRHSYLDPDMAEGLWLWLLEPYNGTLFHLNCSWLSQEVVHLATSQHVHAVLSSRYITPRYVVSHKNAAVDDVWLPGNRGLSSEDTAQMWDRRSSGDRSVFRCVRKNCEQPLLTSSFLFVCVSVCLSVRPFVRQPAWNISDFTGRIVRCVIPVVLLIQHKPCIYFKYMFRQNTTNSMWGGITV